MNDSPIRIRFPHFLTALLYLVLLVSIVFAFRAITSIATGLLLLFGILSHPLSFKRLMTDDKGFTIACIGFFTLQLLALFNTVNFPAAFNDLRIKTGLLFLPLAIRYTSYLTHRTIEKLWQCYCLIIFIASAFLLLHAFYEFDQLHNSNVFFYYNLIEPLRYHPVYFSFLVLTALIYTMETTHRAGLARLSKTFYPLLVLFLSLMLLLLSSKLMISAYLFYLLFTLISWIKEKHTPKPIAFSLLLVIGLSSFTAILALNPLRERFRDLMNSKPNLASQEIFTPADYFNGFQFRLLEWKLVPEILSENKAWWTGLTPGSAQMILNRKYLSKHMYSGMPGRPGHGYLDYNTHSQLLESLLQHGIPGLLMFIAIGFSLLKLLAQLKNRLAAFIIILLLLYACIESVFQEQYGIVIFTFFPLFLWQLINPPTKNNLPPTLQTINDQDL